MQMNTSQKELWLRGLVDRLTLPEKAAIVSGADTWHTAPVPRIGLKSIAMSDGPAGIRGTATELAEVRIASGEELAISFPAPSALAATWDLDLAGEFGRALGSEAIREQADVVLAPVVNLHRTPVGGRHFECYSEDPWLTARLARSIVEGIQSCGVAACVKHLVGNEAETKRTTAISRIDQRTLREVYLAPFEEAIRDGGAWSIMAAYNRLDIDGITEKAVAHPWLLDRLLRDEWNFDGAVVSDWSAAVDTATTARHGLDLVMPGPDTVWSGGKLETAIAEGLVTETNLDEKVLNLLRLAYRVGALGDSPTRQCYFSRAESRALSRMIAARSFVVLRNENDALPFVTPPDSIALIGPNAVQPYLQGGGSASIPLRDVEPIGQSLLHRWPSTRIEMNLGAYSRINAPILDLTRATDPVTGEPGLRLDSTADNGDLVDTWHAAAWPGVIRGLPKLARTVRLRTIVRLAEPGEHWIGVATIGHHRITIDGVEVSRSDRFVGEEAVLDSSANNPEAVGRTVVVDAPCDVFIDAVVQNVDAGGLGVFARASLHHLPPGPSRQELFADAVEAARTHDKVIVVVGTNEDIESEGWDRPHLALPGPQDELVDAVLNARPDAIVVVNAGSPVELPWLHRAQTVLWAWLPGQEFAGALSDVVGGTAEPSGRLPWTLPISHAHAPIPDAIPDAADVVDYTEGIDIGYRGWLRAGAEPLLPLGYGLGWTTWQYRSARVAGWSDAGLRIRCVVKNDGARSGREIVQAYLETDINEPLRPVRWLAGFTTVEAASGESYEVELHIHRRAFEVWDVDRNEWVMPSGGYRIFLGRNVADTPLSIEWNSAQRLDAIAADPGTASGPGDVPTL